MTCLSIGPFRHLISLSNPKESILTVRTRVDMITRHRNKVIQFIPILFLIPLAAFASESDPSGSIEWNRFLGPFHNVVLHYPIGFITMACILEIYALAAGPSKPLTQIIQIVLWLTIGSTVLAATLGFARAGEGGYNAETLYLHKIFGITVISLTGLAIIVSRHAFRDQGSASWRFLYRILLLGTFAAMITTGHKGGDLTHGSDYLTRHVPPVIKQFFGSQQGSKNSPPAPTAMGIETEKPTPTLFAQTIWPTFEAKCIRCHGSEKHKGSFRLDEAEHSQTPGDSEEIPIVPGKPEESFLVTLITMDEDSDEVMPPSGKDPLTEDEKEAIVEWIRSGASYDLVRDK
jgi:uncharacterized membrane protein